MDVSLVAWRGVLHEVRDINISMDFSTCGHGRNLLSICYVTYSHYTSILYHITYKHADYIILSPLSLLRPAMAGPAAGFCVVGIIAQARLRY